MTEKPRSHLSVLNLSCRRGETKLFGALSFDLGAGESLHVCGANGSGKTTLLRFLSALSFPDDGEIFWNGRSIGHALCDYRSRLAYLGHRDAIKEELTPIENLKLAALLSGEDFDPESARGALKRLGVPDGDAIFCRRLSQGQKRRVALARLSLLDRPLWILDEPCAALDPTAAGEVASMIDAHLSSGGLAVVASPSEDAFPHARKLRLSASC
ncbi:MAG: cytochrome c biogenesis heme-transporting ATPase CcmA [Candidatus Accumulibacter sp.]|jgi:heme exporter protein A|nr:cytochrome c biogenesis heme-transporting ATPase CcmA [Accumulibacter sp.]